MRPALSLLLFLWAALAQAQGITLVGPSDPVEPREYVQILVAGLSDADLPAARVEWNPTAGTTLIPARTWGGQPFLWFCAKTPGKYTVSVTTNGWRRTLDQAMEEVGRSGVPSDEFKAAAAALAAAYKSSSAQCVVEVAGQSPDPPVPPPPVVGQRRILLIRETSQATPQMAALIQDLRNLPYLTEKKHTLLILDKDAKGPSGIVPAELARAIADLGGSLPGVVVYSSDGRQLIGKAPCPTDQTEFLELLKKFGG